MADEELFIEEPDVSFHASAAPAKGIVQWDTAPVVVVRMAWNGRNVTGNVDKAAWQCPIER